MKLSREEILEYLSDFEVICEIEEAKSDDFLTKYPQLALGYADYSFQTTGGIYIFRLLCNLVLQKLYFSLKAQSGENLQCCYPLNEFDLNLITCRELKDHKLYFYENKVYFK